MGYYDDYLEHHGILGMKWGIRRFQRKDGTRTAAGKEHAKQLETKKRTGLTDDQKKAILIGAAITAGIVAGYAGYRIYQNSKYKDAKIDPKTGLQLKSREFTPDEDMAAVNVGRANNPIRNYMGQYGNNCALCTATYELRRRGYDVKAGEELNGKSFYDFKQMFNLTDADVDARTTELHLGTTTDLLLNTKVHGPNTRGTLTIAGLFGAHSVVWENDAKGNTILRDCQLNKKMTTQSEMEAYFKSVGMYPAAIMRLDDLSLNIGGASGKKGFNKVWVRNAKDLDLGLSELEGVLAVSGTAVVTGATTGYAVYSHDRKERRLLEDYDDTGESENDSREGTTKRR